MFIYSNVIINLHEIIKILDGMIKPKIFLGLAKIRLIFTFSDHIYNILYSYCVHFKCMIYFKNCKYWKKPIKIDLDCRYRKLSKINRIYRILQFDNCNWNQYTKHPWTISIEFKISIKNNWHHNTKRPWSLSNPLHNLH